MAVIKNSGASGRKQAPVPGPNSAAYKKIVARKSAGKSSKGRRRPRPTAAFSSLKSRQALVERIKREIWASATKINEAVINLALAGNYNAARALFDFAGVYSLPEVEEETEKMTIAAAPVVAAPSIAAPLPPEPGTEGIDPVDAFFRSIGKDPPLAVSGAKAAV